MEELNTEKIKEWIQNRIKSNHDISAEDDRPPTLDEIDKAEWNAYVDRARDKVLKFLTGEDVKLTYGEILAYMEDEGQNLSSEEFDKLSKELGFKVSNEPPAPGMPF